MHSKYDDMHNNRMFDALICINNHVITSINCMLSRIFEEIKGKSKGREKSRMKKRNEIKRKKIYE